MHFHGGREWTAWEGAIARALLDSRRQGEGLDEDGSWDPIGEWGPPSP